MNVEFEMRAPVPEGQERNDSVKLDAAQLQELQASGVKVDSDEEEKKEDDLVEPATRTEAERKQEVQ